MVKEVASELRPDGSREQMTRRAAEGQEQQPDEHGGSETGKVGRGQIG